MNEEVDEGMKEAELAAWVEEQKQDYHAGRLSRYQIEKLEAIPGWSWDLTTTSATKTFEISVGVYAYLMGTIQIQAESEDDLQPGGKAYTALVEKLECQALDDFDDWLMDHIEIGDIELLSDAPDRAEAVDDHPLDHTQN